MGHFSTATRKTEGTVSLLTAASTRRPLQRETMQSKPINAGRPVLGFQRAAAAKWRSEDVGWTG